MSYLVLARRWRPKKFNELVGQPHVARTLLNGLKQGRVAHAYLFSGPRGVGKTTTARLVARAINCSQLSGGEPCGECAACRAISEGHFIDVIEIDAASNRGIDEIRQLRDSVRYAPIEGRSKVYIIDEVHMLTQEAFNALLKTLEEPPEHAYFCLATTAPQKVPATILSRCQRFDFRRVSAPEIRDHLKMICQKDEIKFDAEALDTIARKADGSVRDALSILDQVIAYTNGQVSRQDTVEIIGEVRLDLFSKAVDLVQSGSTREAFELDLELASSGIDAMDFIAGLQTHLVQILQARASGEKKVDVPEEAREHLGRAAGQLGEGDLIRLLQYCSAAEVDIRRNFDPRIRLQLLLLKFASFDRSVDLAELLQRLEGGAAQAASERTSAVSSQTGRSNPSISRQPPPETSGNTAVEKRTQPASPDLVKEKSPVASSVDAGSGEPLAVAQTVWDEVCDRVSASRNSSGRMVKFGGFPVAYEEGKLTLHFASKSHLDTAHACLRMLRKELSAIIGEVELELKVGELPQRGAAEDKPEPESDPAVQLLIDRLGAQPIDR